MMTPKYSRSSINRVGEILANSDFFDDQFQSAVDSLSDWRALHLHPMKTFQTTLRKYVNEIDSKGIVAQRLKRALTIIDKLRNRQTSMSLGRMQDIGGLRAIVNNVSSVRKIEKKFLRSRAKHILKRKYDYIAEPKESGYRGIHLVYEYQNRKKPECDGLLIEIQLRTRLQHLWATAVETVGFFYQESLKSSQGNEHRLEFFRLVSALFSLKEKQPTSLAYRHSTQETLVEQLRQFEKEHGVLQQLNAIKIARSARKVPELADAAYWIIKTNLNPSSVVIYPFLEQQQEQIKIVYHSLEESGECKNGQSQVVLVATDSVDKLGKAYPSFFLDITDFISNVAMLIRHP